jgi:hypothetical protein
VPDSRKIRFMVEASAVSIFAALLDRSVAQIGQLSADGRHFDRQAVARIADVWDNNTFPLFAVALSRPRWLRERRARSALAWMADLGPSRRAWMIEQAAIAGHRLEPLLPPPVHDDLSHFRDYRGQVQPGTVPLTVATAASVDTDYDLARAKVRTVRVERCGQQLGGYIALAAPRRYAMQGGDEAAVVELFLSDLRTARFDSDEQGGATLTADATGVEVRVGVRGHFHADSATVGFDDPMWHLSHAGRGADAATPRRRTARRRPPQVDWVFARGTPLVAAVVLHRAMLEVRSVRHSTSVGWVPLRELCDAFAGGGEGVLSAAGKPWTARDRAFRPLTEGWIAGSPFLADQITDRFPADHWVRTVIPTVSLRPSSEDLPEQAQLTLARYTAAHVRFGMDCDAEAVVNLAVPDAHGQWELRTLEFQQPTHLSVSTAAFTEPHPISHVEGLLLSLGDGTFAVTR